jgi:hypothetical protein
MCFRQQSGALEVACVSNLLAAAGVDLASTLVQFCADEAKRWWGGRDSNPRPEDYESSALTG